MAALRKHSDRPAKEGDGTQEKVRLRHENVKLCKAVSDKTPRRRHTGSSLIEDATLGTPALRSCHPLIAAY